MKHAKIILLMALVVALLAILMRATNLGIILQSQPITGVTEKRIK